MEMDYPKTRMDNFFAKAAGSELADNSMEPITDREYWINEMASKIAQGGGGGSKVYELTKDPDTQTFTLHATYNEVNADLSTGYPLVVRKTTREEDGVHLLDLFAIVAIAAVPDVGYMCAVKGVVTNEQQTFTLEMIAASPDEYFVGTFD